MAFGTLNVRHTLQHFMNVTLSGLFCCNTYLDDLAKSEFAFLGKVVGGGQVHRVHAKVKSILNFTDAN